MSANYRSPDFEARQIPAMHHSALASRIFHLPWFACVGLFLLLAQITILVLLGHSPRVIIWSDLLQLASALCAAVSCLLVSRRARALARPFWYLTGGAVGLWSLGKCLIIYDFDYLGLTTVPIIPLLLLFLSAAPMFFTVFLSDDNFRDTINWEWVLDASQILGLIIIIYLFLIYIPLLYRGDQAVNGLEDRLLLWRNLLLASGLLIRALFARSRSTRNLYLPLALIMGLFSVSTWIGNRAQALSDAPEASWYDLAWSIPFCLITLAAAFWRESPDPTIPPRNVPGISRVAFAYLPSLLLPILLMVKYREVVREQIFLGLFGLIFSIVLFNARLLLTQRRQRLTAEALHATEHQYRSLFERNMAGVFRSTLDGKLLDCNPAFAIMFGYSREELLRIPMDDLYPGGAQERSHWIAKVREEGPAFTREFCFRRKDGSPLWVMLSVNTQKQSGGSTLLEGTLVDITQQKLSSLAIEDWKRRYDAAVLASGQIIYESDPESNRVTLGGCVPEILGYSADELSGDASTWLSLIHPDDTTYYHQQLRAAAVSTETVDFEYRARRKDTTYRTLREQGRAMRDAGGRVVRIVGFIVDSTEQRSLEAQLRQAQKMEAVGRLAGGIAHDFNNLLTVISGYSAIQLERTTLSDPTHHEAEQIKGAADRAAGLTRQLLAFSRQQVMNPRPVNLNDIVRSLDKMLRRFIGEDIQVLTVLDPDLGTVKVDPGQVDQVLMNLIVNARDAMPDGGKLTIQTQNVQLDDSYVRNHDYVKPGRYVLLSVSDNGTGIAPETQARIFEPFFTTKEPGKGTGLGLPMVYGIVKQSGGSIEVYSELHHGTTMNIYLPRVDEAPQQVSSPIRRNVAQNGSGRILLVEDDAQLRRLASEILNAHGYTVHILDKVEDLEATLGRTDRCDLLLTDVVMPGIKGPELALRVSQHWPGVKVLYMSGYTTNAIVHHGVLDEGLFFLQKPFTPSILVAKVREVLNSPAVPKTQN